MRTDHVATFDDRDRTAAVMIEPALRGSRTEADRAFVTGLIEPAPVIDLATRPVGRA